MLRFGVGILDDNFCLILKIINVIFYIFFVMLSFKNLGCILYL